MTKINNNLIDKGKKRVIVTTSTLYRAENQTDKIRAKLALEMIRNKQRMKKIL